MFQLVIEQMSHDDSNKKTSSHQAHKKLPRFHFSGLWEWILVSSMTNFWNLHLFDAYKFKKSLKNEKNW